MNACFRGHLLAATLLIGFGADRARLDNTGHAALRLAEWRVAQDAAPPAAPTAAQREEHARLVAVLKAFGAA
jgi:hypothetical protein